MILEILAIKEINKPVEIPQPKPQATVQVEPEQKKPKKIYYTVVKGDSIVKISKHFKVPVKRIVCANKIVNPDIIYPKDRLKIPKKSDKLKCPKIKSQGKSIDVRNSIIAGNTYEPGQCVWHVKNLKPEIPNGWGSAYQWLYNARASGWATGTTPKVGAVGVKGNHVVYVVQVKGNQVLISEMNYDWVAFHQREIWKPASSYTYIY